MPARFARVRARALLAGVPLVDFQAEAYDGSTHSAVIPQSELHLYATTLHSLTHGFGRFAQRFNGYEQVQADAVQKVIAAHAK